jgi:hypothetical protein
MADAIFGPRYYRRRAALMKELADDAETAPLRALYAQYAAYWVDRANREEMAESENEGEVR